ncbi:MAG TPA: PaaI family thioesterase [Candidatus Paraprevotella stercorigallinarum]|jgi:acyl-CoA thioesterase|nr:PaaI family thioesterase [Candidatus Paraprevotella stercorigallinarum]
MKLTEFLLNDRFAREAGATILHIEPGYARVSMEVTPRHLNAAGVCQGGAIFTLADLAFAAVANSHKNITLSLSANIAFLKSVKEGVIYAEARETFNHGKIPYIEVRILDEQNELIAILTSTGYRKKDELPVDGLE